MAIENVPTRWKTCVGDQAMEYVPSPHRHKNGWGNSAELKLFRKSDMFSENRIDPFCPYTRSKLNEIAPVPRSLIAAYPFADRDDWLFNTQASDRVGLPAT